MDSRQKFANIPLLIHNSNGNLDFSIIFHSMLNIYRQAQCFSSFPSVRLY